MNQTLRATSTLMDRRRMLTRLGLTGLGLAAGSIRTARAQTKTDGKSPATIAVTPPPSDLNDLNMEVAALRTLYLLKAGSDQLTGIKTWFKEGVMKPRKRQEPKVSANYRKVLTELRAAFIAGQEERISELSEQLEELTKEEQPEFDDAVEVTDYSRKNAAKVLQQFDPPKVVAYLAAYGKDFPEPWKLLYSTMRLDGKGTKLPAEQWKDTRAFVIQEVSWQVGGLDLARQQKIGEDVARLLDRAYPMTNEELKKQGVRGGALRGEVSRISGQASPTDVLKHVIEQDLAELMSNPRLLPAIDARLTYLK